MKRIFLLLYIFSFSISFSQLQIVRDPIACAYGLKNASKQWVVPAQYQEIQMQGNGFFTFKEGETWGLLTRMGKVFTTAKYDQIYQITPERFMMVTKKENDGYNQNWMGIMDTSKNWILPQEFSSIQQLNNGRFLVTKTNYSKFAAPKHQSAILAINGEPQTPYFNGMILYKFNEQSIFVVGDNLVESSTVSGNVRFYSAEGIALSDSTFDKVTPCGENYTVLKNNKFGLFNAEGKPIVWPTYQFEFNQYSYSNSLPCLHSHHQFIFTKNGKKGILNGNWEILLEPIYEKLITINTQVQTATSARYFAYRSETNSYDLIDVNGTKLAEADTFMTKNIRVPKTNYYDMDAYRIYFFFGKRQEKGFNWGIMDEKGTVLIPATNASILVTNNFEVILVEDKKNNVPTANRVDLTNANAAGFQAQPLNFVKQLDSVYLFQFEQNYYPLLYNKTQKTWQQEMYDYQLPKLYGNLLLISGNMGGFVYDKQTQQATKVIHIDLYNGGFPTVQTMEGINLIHPQKGFLFKENFTQINQQFKSKNRIWTQTSNGKWQVYDTLGVKRINVDFDVISYDWNAVIAQVNFKKGLLDENFTWQIQPIFEDLFPFTKNIYVGLTPSKKVSVIHLNRPNEIDTSYTTFLPLYNASDGNQTYYCLENKGNSTCFDEKGLPINFTKKDIITEFWTASNNINYFYIQCDNVDYKAYLQIQKDLVYNHLFWIYWNQMKTNKNSIINGERGNSYYQNKNFKLEYASSKNLSLSVSEQAKETLDMDYGRHNIDVYFDVTNWIFKTDGTTKKIEFSDLFSPSNIQYQNVIIEAIQDNPNIHFDCTRPETLFQGAKNFAFQKDGIKLFFFYGQNQAFEITLSKTQLLKIPSAKWIVNYIE